MFTSHIWYLVFLSLTDNIFEFPNWAPNWHYKHYKHYSYIFGVGQMVCVCYIDALEIRILSKLSLLIVQFSWIMFLAMLLFMYMCVCFCQFCVSVLCVRFVYVRICVYLILMLYNAKFAVAGFYFITCERQNVSQKSNAFHRSVIVEGNTNSLFCYLK